MSRSIEVTTIPSVTTVAGKRVVIDDDAAGVMRALREIDDRFRCHYLVDEARFVLELHTPEPDGSVTESLVGTYDALDHRIVHRAQEFTRPDFSIADELERQDTALNADREYARSQETGDMAERLGHALRKDLGRHEAANTLKSRAFIPAVIRKD